MVPHSCRSVQPKVNCSQSPVPPSQILVSFVTFGFTHYFFPDNLNYISHPSVKDSAVPAVFIFPHTEEMLHRHALLSIKDVFLKSVTLKIITPLLHSSFSTDSINPSLSGEDDDDTETATIQKEVASTLTLKDWYWGLGLRDEAVGIFDLLQKAGISSRRQFWSCSHHSIHPAIYTVPVHLNCVYFSPCTYPTHPTEKLLCSPNSLWCLTCMIDNS